MTVATAPDTDGDGTPDFRDTDSDGDTIADHDETDIDTDGDGIPNYRDLDSRRRLHSRCVRGRRRHAGEHAAGLDTNNNGVPDFEDLDSDGDGLRDQLEDLNCNGKVDACETSRVLVDTDGDGVPDLVEYEDCQVATGGGAERPASATDPTRAAGPLQRGDFFFNSAYQEPPVPTKETLALSTNVSHADVLFVLDTTSSMNAAISALETGLKGIVSSVQSSVSNIAFGVAEFRDFTDPFVFRYDYRITSANTMSSPTIAAVTSALGLASSGGGDPPGSWVGGALRHRRRTDLYRSAATAPPTRARSFARQRHADRATDRANRRGRWEAPAFAPARCLSS